MKTLTAIEVQVQENAVAQFASEIGATLHGTSRISMTSIEGIAFEIEIEAARESWMINIESSSHGYCDAVEVSEANEIYEALGNILDGLINSTIRIDI
jgi:hypothetical protein